MTINPALQRPLEDYIVYFEKLSQRSVRLLDKMAAPGMRFRNPFNDVTGTDAVMRVITKIFEDTDRPKLRVTDAAWGRDGYTAYLRWTFTFSPKGKKDQWIIEGMSEVTFGPDGKVVAHLDHWDTGSQILDKIPLTRWMWSMTRKKIAV